MNADFWYGFAVGVLFMAVIYPVGRVLGFLLTVWVMS